MAATARDSCNTSCGMMAEGAQHWRQNSPNLDILRAVAVLTVVVDHLVPTLVFHGYEVPRLVQLLTLHIGHAGVLAFFVHTSLVLMYSLERTSGTGTGAWFRRFYLRRGFRIYPLALTCVVAVVAFGLPEGSWKEYRAPTWEEITANLLLIQNLWTGHSVLTPLWSLPYEVEMYIVLPVLYLVARRSDALRWLAYLMVTAVIGGYVFRKLQHGHMNLAAYVPCFLAGVICYALRERITPKLSGRWWPLVVLGAVTTYCVAHTVSESLIYWYGWLYCIGIASLIPLFADSQIHWLNRAAERVATYSYGIYLLHVPALHIVFTVWQPGSLVLALALFLALTAVLAVVAYHVIEAPMIRLASRSGRRRPSPVTTTAAP
ncbi:MAG TPA: acyltransferase [Kofleriaceae bacterium]|nr:acyltransferase [Kofleriaceae bacterium]